MPDRGPVTRVSLRRTCAVCILFGQDAGILEAEARRTQKLQEVVKFLESLECQNVRYSISDFLVEEDSPGTLLAKWAPEHVDPESFKARAHARLHGHHKQMQARSCHSAACGIVGTRGQARSRSRVTRVLKKPAAFKKPAGELKVPKWYDQHKLQAQDLKVKKKDQAQQWELLKENPFFEALTPRPQQCLVLELCRELQRQKHGQEARNILDIQSSVGRVPKGTSKLPCPLPRSIVWLCDAPGVQGGRLLFGVESLALMGAHVPHLRSVQAGVYYGSFLQDLAGNAFMTSQFVNFILATWITT